MTKYDNNLKGVLFKNDRKEQDNHPDYTGSAEIEGTEYWIAAWIKSGDKGKFMSLSFTAKEEKKSKPSKKAEASDDLDDDIPF